MIWDHHNPPFRVTKYVVASISPSPVEANILGHFAELTVGNEPQPGHAATSIRQVPTNSGRGSSGRVSFK